MNDKTMLTSGKPVTEDHKEIKANGQLKDYVVLTDEERSKGFVEPVRTNYVHDTCGVRTQTGLKIAETYARDPKFYGSTFCMGCGDHFPVSEFKWDGTDRVVGSHFSYCVLYHSSCYDGFGSAYAAWKEFGDNAIYIPVSYGHGLPKGLTGSRFDKVFILDFSFNEDDLLKIKENCETVILIDHHKTAKEMLEPLMGKYNWLKINFDMTKSGALMSWEYFRGTYDPIPMLIQHISDRDLWNFDLEGTNEIHAALVSHPMDFELWDGFEENLTTLKIEGDTCKRLTSSMVSKICKGAWIGTIGDIGNVPMVNTTIAWSEVGHELLKAFPRVPFVASFTVFENQVMWSLRSRKDGDNFDVSAVAKKFGGGGHRNASGFKTARY